MALRTRSRASESDGVREAHDLAARQARRDVHLDAHELAAQAADDGCVQDREHAASLASRRFTRVFVGTCPVFAGAWLRLPVRLAGGWPYGVPPWHGGATESCALRLGRLG